MDLEPMNHADSVNSLHISSVVVAVKKKNQWLRVRIPRVGNGGRITGG